MPSGDARRLLCATLVVVYGCSAAVRPRAAESTTPTSAAEDSGPASALPAVPHVTGPVRISIVYPARDALVQARDSTFILGSVGTGDATLTIDGEPVRVLPNGAFLAWLPVPRPAGRYELVAAAGADTVRLRHPVRLPPPRMTLSDTGRVAIDTTALLPRAGDYLYRASERVRVAVRAPRNASVWVQPAVGAGLPLVSAAAVAAVSHSADSLPVDGTLWSTDLPASQLAARASLMVARDRDTIVVPLPAPAVLAADAAPTYVLLGAGGATVDTDRVIVGRPVPQGTYKWFFLPRTAVELTGRVPGAVRVRLDASLEVWVDAADATPLPAGYAPVRRVAGARVVPDERWVDVVVSTGERPPYSIEQLGRTLVLTLYGTQLSPEILPIAGNDTLVRQVEWTQDASDRARITLQLSRAPYGYLVLWDATRNSLVLRLRRTPSIDGRHPLRGRTVVVDAGHPPGGATGPTGLWEPVATLAVAEKARALLEARGARVIMTRTTAEPVGLSDRPIVARRADADAFISIHLNALPDGVNPFTANGTSTLFFNQMSEPFARIVQRSLMSRLGLRDLGVHYQNLAVARPTWVPSVLCEGAFLTIPEQEAALRTESYRDAYARGVADGVERFFKSVADAR